MFTGIIDHYGEIIGIKEIPQGRMLQIKSDFEDLTLGESIAVDGICLTVTEILPESFCCELSPETCEVTTAKNFTENALINLERAVRAIDRIGGHIVTGHVDTIGSVILKENQGEFLKVQFQWTNMGKKDKNLCPFFIQKGSVAVNGVSLTLNEVFQDTFEVMLIPHTLDRTNLKDLNVGDNVNIECDYFAKIIVNTIAQMKLGNL